MSLFEALKEMGVKNLMKPPSTSIGTLKQSHNKKLRLSLINKQHSSLESFTPLKFRKSLIIQQNSHKDLWGKLKTKYKKNLIQNQTLSMDHTASTPQLKMKKTLIEQDLSPKNEMKNEMKNEL